MDSGKFFGNQQPNEQFKPSQECWCKGVSLEDFISHLKPSIGDEVEKALIRVLGPIYPSLQQSVLPPNSSSLPHHVELSTSKRFRLCFKEDLPETLFTMNKIGDEGPLVELLDEAGKRAEFGPEYPLKIKIDALDGDLDHEEYKDKINWTEEDYTKYIAKPRKGKGAILKGRCDIPMSGGAVSVGHISFTDNSTTMRNKTYRLGARVAKGLPAGVVIKPAISTEVRVKERRLKSVKRHISPPSIDNDLGNVVMDFLQRCDTTNAKEQLQRILGVPKTCKLIKEQKVTFKGQTTQLSKSLDNDSQKVSPIVLQEQADKPRIAAYPIQSGLPTIYAATNHISNQELTSPSIIQGAGSLLSNHTVCIPPTGVYHDAPTANLAYQVKPVEHVNSYNPTPMLDSFSLEDDLQLAAFSQDADWGEFFELLDSTPLQEERSNVSEASGQNQVTSKLIAACYVHKAATLFMISVQQDANVPKKKQKTK